MAEEERVAHEEYKCPSCGAPMHFDPASHSLKCDYCDTVIKLNDENSGQEFSLDDAETEVDLSWQQENHVLRCSACGAENVVNKKEMSLVCPFCGSTQVVEVNELAGKKPNRIIPFNITEEAARACYQRFLKKKLFCPSSVKKLQIECQVNGVYIPSWTYDADTYSSYHGRLGEHYTVTVGSGKDRRTEVRTRYFTISGRIQVFFDDVLVNAGSSINNKELEKLEPYDTNNSNDFNESFLAGFGSEHYSLTVKNGFNRAKEIMAPQIERKILNQYTYDVVDYLNVKTQYDNVTYKYVLLPVWIGNFKIKEKSYRFLVNGENGKTTGKYPMSALRISLFTLFIIAVVVGIILYFVLSE